MEEEGHLELKQDIHNAIAESLARHGEMLLKWATVLEVLTTDGNRMFVTVAQEDARTYEVYGMFAYGQHTAVSDD